MLNKQPLLNFGNFSNFPDIEKYIGRSLCFLRFHLIFSIRLILLRFRHQYLENELFEKLGIILKLVNNYLSVIINKSLAYIRIPFWSEGSALFSND
ncbi:hypothetical protein BpHYR1_023160 [Brachionus plicatilis]|uniref:Uncharacterized protein n=1 Tax=Brachionus plicatilis TaxID=10195 RepID=A0A3M7SXX3_BRAPC|nr:hypothetical protein BpHYR1_023160 [Brachionus plicatilis]